MNQHERDLHNYHIEIFFDCFFDDLERRKTNQEILSYILFKIEIEEKRLNRYKSDLTPDLYVDHRIYIQDIEGIIQKMKDFKEDLFPKPENIEPIRLMYGKLNEEIIEVIYKAIFLKKIDVTYEVFKAHFYSETKPEEIYWKGFEPEIVHLFKNLKIQTPALWELISKHFINNKGENFKPKQLGVVYDKTVLKGYKGKSEIDQLINTINNLSKG